MTNRETTEHFASLYKELHELSGRALRRERRGHTLSPTDLLHEAYLRLSSSKCEWENEAHFRNTAALYMRRALVDHAKRKRSLKKSRPGEGERVTLSEVEGELLNLDVLDIEELLEELERLSPRQAEVVTKRFYGGLTYAEIAESLGVSEDTVSRDWQFAKAWLLAKLEGKR